MARTFRTARTMQRIPSLVSVSSKTFLSFCLVAFGAVCLDQGLEFSKILDNAVDVPLYEFFANRKPAFRKVWPNTCWAFRNLEKLE